MFIFVDLDGVITNFQKKLSELLGHPVKKEFGDDPKIWAAISRAGKKFWSEMEWMPDGRELWEAIEIYDPTILSAPSNHPSSVEGKKEWLKENLPDVPYIIEQKKEKHAGKDKILIDDREKNIKKWEEAGGIGILHKDAKTTIDKLKKVMGEIKEAAEEPRRVWIDRSRKPGRPGKVIPPKKGGPYKRPEEKDWKKHIQASEKLREIANILNNFKKE
jgi:5'(3')-deoxyribonucleotidase